MQSERLEDGVRRITAPNPSPMTFTGTQTYLIGEGEVVVIDPGPAMEAHLRAILGALEPGERVAQILVTHSHLDHSPLARPLAEATGAPVLAAGPSDWGRSAVMRALADAGGLGGGEGVDESFAPDTQIKEGDNVEGAWGRIDVLATPGHMANHLSFAWNGTLFSGDLVMGWSTSLVSPPDGDMTAFLASTTRLAARDDRVYYPGHGEPIPDPQDRANALIAHRKKREAQIMAALEDLGPSTASELARAIYTDVAPALLRAAERNVLAHLIDLTEKSATLPESEIAANARFALR
ncbi:MBL fold metallo-hydrolase [Hasllibacter sp. MH4015]|uniref:MBL fold metallo-hydrolase n=1 Tax=Hasllibacter sp. MH4015 TaxID=2854029 RepID=UPI001CD7401F|nr:MBL fold metallo-hydrolase [Hasllibacter sp. MH4015]